MSKSLNSTLLKFRLDYPEAEVISELLSIHEQKYLVRVLIKFEGKTIASGLGGANQIEQAEDIARARAWGLLNSVAQASEPVTTPLPQAVVVPVTTPNPAPITEITAVDGKIGELTAAINLEMTRINWTKEQGKEYLLKTYGKKSRHLLSDLELQEFLNYLKGQVPQL